MQQNSERAFWRTHLAIIAFLIFVISLAFILLSQQTSLLVLGTGGLILAHVAAFGGAALYTGGWLTHWLRNGRENR
ncbi:MAG: hypothetical protein AAF614_30625 [Chloroflexota bacterium]